MPSISDLLVATVVGVAAAMGIAGCGSTDEENQPRSSPPAVVTCGSNWTNVAMPASLAETYRLRWYNGEIFALGGILPPAFAAVPDGGGLPRTVNGVDAERTLDFWIEGNEVILKKRFPAARPLVPVLEVVPLQGGVARPFATASSFKDLPVATIPAPIVVSPMATFVGISGYEPTFNMVRIDRATGEERPLRPVQAGPGESLFFSEAYAWQDWVLVWGPSGSASFSANGAASFYQRGTVPFAQVLAASATGQVLWTGPDVNRGRLVTALGIARIASPGEPLPLAHDLPDDIYIQDAWEGPAGGWYLSAIETMNDGAPHLAVWYLSSTGKGQRLGCDPKAGWMSWTGTVSPRGLFVVSGARTGELQREVNFIAGP